jgi:magnesium chelatase family protein
MADAEIHEKLARVVAARGMQFERQGCANALLGGRDAERHAETDADGSRLLADAIDRLGLSARAYHRVLKVARTIADLAGDARVQVPHVAEAISYRRLDRKVGAAL